ncbi:MAG: response regulator with CheY-like receiver domain and winged-helix DNA-binding domain, partial [Thermoleophilia bacterium]|nr:response regulator with CheY-like receiver domain and winged-helix DNA-binding domain [Thermoleophilia bacterium]
VLSSSEAERDIASSYELHANCYVTKPIDFAQFVQVVQAIEHFWFTVVKLPPHAA